MSYEPLHHKYRPKSFAELVGQSAIAKTLINAINTSRIAPAYLFTGPRGTGKTSSARILAKSLNCLNSPQPTATPCGVCDVCLGITKGYTVDVIEIDAASNTGVENVRDIIEKAQFAPVQCRYKVYVIDECLTGDSLVLTSEGLVRIDNPEIKGKKVLSYNDSTGNWEYKTVVRHFDQGERQTLVIKTTNREIRCTGNHLIRTDQGWIRARDIKEGTRILSPANAVVAPSFTNTVKTDASEDLYLDTSSKAIPTGKKHTISNKFWNKLNHFDPSALANVENNSIFQNFYSAKAKDSAAYYPIGKNIHTRKDTAFGNLEQSITLPKPKFYQRKHWDLFTEPCSETVQLLTPIKIADIQDWLGRTQTSNKIGWSIKPLVYKHYNPNCGLLITKDMAVFQSPVTQSAILNFKKFSQLLNQVETINSSPKIGLPSLLPKGLLGGTSMMGHSALALKVVRKFSCIQKDSPARKMKLLLTGLQKLDIQQQLSVTQEAVQAKNTTTSTWAQVPVESGWQTSKNIQSPQWTTSLETVESVHLGGIERVYDIEVEDNHNFVANGLLVHNCHMLSTQAFNALLKTLEEPPKHIVFVLATTDPQRVLPTIISRCQRFDFRRIPLDDMVAHLTKIAIEENINITTEAITLVAQLSQGGLRDAESLLDQLSLLPEQVNPNNVWDLVGTVSEHDLYWLFKAIAADDAEALIENTRKILDRGREPLTILQNLAGFYRDLLIAKTASTRGDLVACTQETWQALVELVKNVDIHEILAGQQHLRTAEVQLKNTTQPRLWLEVTLLGLLPSAHQQIAPSTSTAPIFTPQHKGNNLPANGKAPTQPNNNYQGQANQSKAANYQSPTNNNQAPTTNYQAPANNQAPTTNYQAPANNQAPTTNYQAPTNNQAPTTNYQVPTNNQAPTSNNLQNDLAQTWQQVLSHLEPVSRRELLRQMCNVLEIRSEFARLGVRQAWHKRVQEDLPIIRRAFKATFNREITVNLEVISPASHRAKEESVTYTATEEPPPINVKNNTQNYKETLQNNPAQNNSAQNNPVQNNPPKNGSYGVKAPSNHTHTQATAAQQPQSVQEIGKKPDIYKDNNDDKVSDVLNGEAPQTEEDVSPGIQIQPVVVSSMDAEKVWYAAERLAQFFDGQIIGYNEDAAEFADSAASSDLIDVVENEDDD